MNSNKIKALCVGLMVLGMSVSPCLYAQETEEQTELPEVVIKDTTGKFEIGVYYGHWTLSPIISSFEQDIVEALGEEIRDAITAQAPVPVVPTTYEETFNISSGGPNYGIEVRFYPQGRSGSFSFGFSLDKVTMRVSADEGYVRQDYLGWGICRGDGTGRDRAQTSIYNPELSLGFCSGLADYALLCHGFGCSCFKHGKCR